MAENAKDLIEYFLENDDEGDIEDNNNNRNTSDDDDKEEGDEIGVQKLTSSSSSYSPFFSQQWPQSFRETIDSYSIAASPNVGLLRRGSSITISPYDTKRYIDSEEKAHLLSEATKPDQKGFRDGISSKHSSYSEKASLHEKLTGELPISHGCSLTQTVFNGLNVMAGIGLLSTPFTVKEAGWASIAVLVIFAVICCYTASLMKHFFEIKEGLTTYPDMGEAAFGKY